MQVSLLKIRQPFKMLSAWYLDLIVSLVISLFPDLASGLALIYLLNSWIVVAGYYALAPRNYFEDVVDHPIAVATLIDYLISVVISMMAGYGFGTATLVPIGRIEWSQALYLIGLWLGYFFFILYHNPNQNSLPPKTKLNVANIDINLRVIAIYITAVTKMQLFTEFSGLKLLLFIVKCRLYTISAALSGVRLPILG